MTAWPSAEEKRPIILCVEDEEQLRRDIADELIEAGYDVIEACNGEEALESLRRSRPDLILCDISMPGLSGYEVLNALEAKGSDYAETPFVFLSALADPRQIAEGKRLGADDYLVKPIDYDLLLATVDARLRQIERIRSARQAQDANLDAMALSARFGLTTTETRIAMALVDGTPPPLIARDFQVSRTTVAFHIRNIFHKTGTNRQAALVSVLLKTP